MSVQWNLYDADAEIAKSERNLPHWDQTKSLTFVTMRLADSMPRKVVQKWHHEIEQWLRKQDIKKAAVNEVLTDPAIAPKLKRQLKRFKHRRWHNHLDDCYGTCPLRDPKFAQVVGDSLLYFNGLRFDLERFVIMPNHAHLLIQMRSGFSLRKELAGIMRFNGRRINRLLGKRGNFWQPEPFDHIVRNEKQFAYLQNYILDNPKKAKLIAGEFLFWQSAT